MSGNAASRTSTVRESCITVAEGLRSRQADIAQAMSAHIRDAVPVSIRHQKVEYEAGLRVAVQAVVSYSLDAIEHGPGWSEPIPPAVAVQARRAARAGVSIGTVMRRYLAGREWFVDFLRAEVKRGDHTDHEAVLEHLRATYRSLLHHLIMSVESEYEQERERVACSPKTRAATLVRRLLAEDVDPSEIRGLGYEITSFWHIGLIASRAEGTEILQNLRLASGYKLLLVRSEDGVVLAWLGSSNQVTIVELKRFLSANGYPDPPLAIGEPGSGLQGWRQTHEEARVAALVVRQEPCGLTRCADVLPIAGALMNETLIRMYKKIYVLPLSKLPRDGRPTRRVLLAYFKHGRSASCAAEAANVTRRTVQNHLNEARRVLDAPLNLTGLEIALHLEELGYMTEVEDDRPLR
jgi:DNA-binding transcriptional ArsR family regulator